MQTPKSKNISVVAKHNFLFFSCSQGAIFVHRLAVSLAIIYRYVKGYFGERKSFFLRSITSGIVSCYEEKEKDVPEFWGCGATDLVVNSK